MSSGRRGSLGSALLVPPVNAVRPLERGEDQQILNVCTFESLTWTAALTENRPPCIIALQGTFTNAHSTPCRLGDRVHAPSHRPPHSSFIET